MPSPARPKIEPQIHDLIDLLPQKIILLDRNSVYLYCNRCCAVALGIEPGDIAGKTHFDFHPREVAAACVAEDRLVIAAGIETTVETRRLDNGVETWARTTRIPVRDASGQVTGLVGIFEDITDQKRAEDALRESERRLREIFETVDLVTAMLDAHGNLTFCNQELLKLTGWKREEVIGRNWFRTFRPPEQSENHLERFLRHIAAGTIPLHYEGDVMTRDGRRCVVFWSHTLMRDAGGRVVGVASIGQDVTERKRAEEQLLLAGKVFAHSAEAIMITDPGSRILSVNPAFVRITGYQADEVIGKTPRILSSGRHDREFYRKMWTALIGTGFWSGEIWDRRKTGEIYPKWLSINAVYDEKTGAVSHCVAAFTDITERKVSEARIRRLAHYDFLTDLPNRALFNDRLSQILAVSRRRRKPFAVMFIDLDRFKNVNDSLGHRVGDVLLQQVASRVSGVLRETDTVCRQGGDEFVVLLPEIGHAEDAAHVARKAVEAISRPYQVHGHELTVTASAGISVFPEDGEDVDTLLKNADSAMYHAKSGGRNGFQFFKKEMNDRTFEKLLLENALRRALDRDELTLDYQPIIDTTEDTVVAMEALVRWSHPELGTIMPARFIPIAEESGLILQVGEWVIGEACRQNRRWQEAGLLRAPIAVNLSPVQFLRSDVTDVIGKALRASGLEPHYLELEVTESAFITDVERTIDNLHALKDMGVSLAVDDFGTGYSSLAYLKRFPVDKLKVDQSFVRDISTDPGDAAICSAIIGLGQNLRLAVVAEGVETEAQVSFLRHHGCSVMQGYRFSRQMPSAAATEYLRLRSAAGR